MGEVSRKAEAEARKQSIKKEAWALKREAFRRSLGRKKVEGRNRKAIIDHLPKSITDAENHLPQTQDIYEEPQPEPNHYHMYPLGKENTQVGMRQQPLRSDEQGRTRCGHRAIKNEDALVQLFISPM
ncbi:hypothetical protein VNO77_15274 [Canavalia gladiata]|uniref:Uncharacterized protein n=1 Tax=Canavalia gladiata TaxID=3824 RepID=A0AAN9LZD9_CANGL